MHEKYECDLCEYKTCRSDQLKSHCRKKHSEIKVLKEETPEQGDV